MSDEGLPELFDEASALDAAGRRRLLERVRGEDPALADELARLLAEPEAAPSPIDAAPALPLAGEHGDGDPPPERVGPYRILEQIGKGGMGRVFLAEQATPDFSRKVALKLIDRPGPDPEAVRRFRDEVRILASLEHPWIVRFLDGGRSPEGIWFLALEYVEGEDLVAHARRNDLDFDARVRLVMAVAEAVAYAHERGVVHRDLKPGNVLVGRDGRPRLLDFGISKLLDPGGDTHLTTTAHGARMLTPAYASPEQLGGRPVTPASDVYSLGVILYELLAGSRPTTATGDETAPASPEPPSTVARRFAATGERSSPRAAGARRAARKISRDLDAVCLEALRHDPAARYADAAALLADLRRYLDGEPVAARRGRSRWSDRRNKWLAVAAVATGVLALAGYGWRTSLTAGRAAAAPLSTFPFDPVDPPPAEESERRLAETPDDVVAGAALAFRLVRDQCVDEARLVLGRLRQIPGEEGDPLVEYVEGRIAAVSGEDQRALVHYTRARDSALAERRTELLGTIRTSRAAMLSKLGQPDAALAELEAARADSERLGDPRTLYRTFNGLALVHHQRGDVERADAALEQALAAADAAGLVPKTTLYNLAVGRLLRGRPDLAEPMARRLYELEGQTPDSKGDNAKTLGTILRDLGRTSEADRLYDEALGQLRRTQLHISFADALLVRAEADLEDGRLERVDAWTEELEAVAERSSERLPLGLARSVAARRAALAGDLAAARTGFAEAGRLLRPAGELLLAEMSDVAWAEAELRAGDTAAALAVLDGLTEAAAAGPRDTTAFLAATLRVRIDAESDRLPAARTALASLEAAAADSPSVKRRLALHQARAAVAAREGRLDEARTELDGALALARAAGRRVVELDLEIERSLLAGEGAAAALLAVALEAESSGLGAAAAQARRLAAAVGGSAGS